MDTNPQSPLSNNAEETKKKGFWRDTIQFILIATIIIVPFRMFIAQPFIVEGRSMDPTFKNSEYLIVDEITYRFHEPERYSVLIFKYPNDPKKYFIKRVIGLPEEKIKIDSGKVTITTKDGQEIAVNDSYVVYPKPDNLTLTLKNNEYYVMGDNRAESLDSRYWGPLDKKYIIGRPILRLLPLTKLAIFPGEVK